MTGSAYEDANAALKDYQANQVGADNAPVPPDTQDEANAALLPYMTPGGNNPAGPQGPQDNLKDLPQPVGFWASMAHGAGRQLGRFWEGIKQKSIDQPVPYGVDDPGQMQYYQNSQGWDYDRQNAYRDLQEEKAQAEQEYAPYAKGHPYASTAGEIAATLPLALLGPQRVLPQAAIAALEAGMQYHDPKSSSAGDMLTAFPTALALGKLANVAGRVATRGGIQKEFGARFDLGETGERIDPVDRAELGRKLDDIKMDAADNGVPNFGETGKLGLAFDNVKDWTQPLTTTGLRTHASAASKAARGAPYWTANAQRATARAMNDTVSDYIPNAADRELFTEGLRNYGKFKQSDPLGSGIGLKEMIGSHFGPAGMFGRVAAYTNPMHYLPEGAQPHISPIPFTMTGGPIRKGLASGLTALATGASSNPQTLQVLGGMEDAATGLGSGLRARFDPNTPQ
jgi:hypothetical protein